MGSNPLVIPTVPASGLSVRQYWVPHPSTVCSLYVLKIDFVRNVTFNQVTLYTTATQANRPTGFSVYNSDKLRLGQLNSSCGAGATCLPIYQIDLLVPFTGSSLYIEVDKTTQSDLYLHGPIMFTQCRQQCESEAHAHRLILIDPHMG